MRPATHHLPARILGLACALLLGAPGFAHAEPRAAPIADSTWVDNDRRPIERPEDWQPNFWGQRFHEGLIDPLSHLFDVPDKLLWLARGLGARTRREAVNVNAFDEAPNSAWFTNRNPMRPVPVAELLHGPDSVFLPRTPWTIKHAKQGGVSNGFQVTDAAGKKWLVKLDSRGSLQLSSGADVVARTLLHAPGYNVPHNAAVRFRREDLVIDPNLLHGTKGELYTAADLDSTLAQGATFADGSYSATASLFLTDHILGSPSMLRRRPGDTNDWYSPQNRRELRGLYVVCSWIGNWDTEDHQFLDTFVESQDSLGHVHHYVLDSGSSFGASASGPKMLADGYENVLDLRWIATRFATLGFVEEPWRRAHQESGMPSIARFESAEFQPAAFKPGVPQPAFRELTDRDGYWGAKVVASFSDAQIAAAVDAAHFEDQRASAYLVHHLIVRRDKIARYWFARVAPLDFFTVEDGALRFHDLAVDLGLAGARAYDVDVASSGGTARAASPVHVRGTQVPLPGFDRGASHLSLDLAITGDAAKRTHVELARQGATWIVTRVRHG